jgi:hypothetical protein
MDLELKVLVPHLILNDGQALRESHLLESAQADLLLLLPWRLSFEHSLAVSRGFKARVTPWIEWMLILIKIRSKRVHQLMRLPSTPNGSNQPLPHS